MSVGEPPDQPVGFLDSRLPDRIQVESFRTGVQLATVDLDCQTAVRRVVRSKVRQVDSSVVTNSNRLLKEGVGEAGVDEQ